MNMTFIFKGVLSIFACCLPLVFFSCQKGGMDDGMYGQQMGDETCGFDFGQPFDTLAFAASLHNEAMDYLLEGLEADQAKGQAFPTKAAVKGHLVAFFDNYGKEGSGVIVTKAQEVVSSAFMEEVKSNFMAGFDRAWASAETMVEKGEGESLVIEPGALNPPGIRQWLLKSELERIITESDSYDEIERKATSALEGLEDGNHDNPTVQGYQLTTQEKEAYVYALTTLIASAGYWSGNIGQWEDALIMQNPYAKKRVRLTGWSIFKIIAADAMGALIGFVAGGIGGSIGFGIGFSAGAAAVEVGNAVV